MLHHFAAEAQDVEIEDMRVAALFPPVFREEPEIPQREIAAVDERVVRADGIVRDNEAALHDIDEIAQSVCFQHVKEPVDFERIVEGIAVSLQFIAV